MSALSIALQRVAPQRLLCASIYRLARARAKLIKDPLIGWFIHQYGIDLDDYEGEGPADYESFNDFFTRALLPGARPIDPAARSVVSPVDGRLTEFGRIDRDRLLQAKGRHYTLAELLGDEGEALQRLTDGHFATIYLAPHNYHRIHAAVAGEWSRTRYIPGRRYCVNEETARAIDLLFCRNERACCWFETPAGPSVTVLVGALNVASISTVPLGELASGTPGNWNHAPRIPVDKGDEIGRFNLGSTVILLFADGAIEWLEELETGQTVRMGQPIGRLLEP